MIEYSMSAYLKTDDVRFIISDCQARLESGGSGGLNVSANLPVGPAAISDS